MMNPNTLSMFDGLGALGDVGSGGKGGIGAGAGGTKPGFQPAASSTPDYSAPPANVGEGQQVSSNDPNYGKATYAPPSGGKQWTAIPELPGTEPLKPSFDPGSAQKWALLNKKADYTVTKKVFAGFNKPDVDKTFVVTVADQYAAFKKSNDAVKAAWDMWLWKLKNVAEFVGIATTPAPLPPFTYPSWCIVFGKAQNVAGQQFGGSAEYQEWKKKNDKAISDFVNWTTVARVLGQPALEEAAKKRGLTKQYTLTTPKADLAFTKDLNFDDPAALAVVAKADAYFAKIAPSMGLTPQSYQTLVAMCKTSKFWKLKDAQDLLNYVVEAADVAPILVQAYSVFKGTLPLAVDGNPYPLTQAQYDQAAVDLRGGSQSQWWDWSVSNAQKLLAKVQDAYNKAKKWSDDKVKAQDVAITAALSDADTSFAEMQKYIKPLSGTASINNPNVWTPDQYANAKNTAKGNAWSTTSAKTFRDKVLAQTALAKQWYLTYTPPPAPVVEQPPAPVAPVVEQPPAPVAPVAPVTTTPVTTTVTTTSSGGGGGGGGGSFWSFAPPVMETPPVVAPPVVALAPPVEEKKSGFVPLAALGVVAWALLSK